LPASGGLRGTLLACESKYQTRSLSNLKYRRISTLHCNNNDTKSIDPWFVTGFADAEGCFRILLRKSNSIKTGCGVGLEFKVEGHKKEIQSLQEIKVFFKNKGSITIHGYARYCIASVKDPLDVLIPHFDQFSLRTAKQADDLLFRRAIVNIKDGKHLTVPGWQEIVNIRAILNWGLTPNLKLNFPNTIPVERPNVPAQGFEPLWFSGFVSGDGAFMVGRVISFSVRQHLKDAALIESFKEIFKCGRFTYFRNQKPRCLEFLAYQSFLLFLYLSLINTQLEVINIIVILFEKTQEQVETNLYLNKW